MVEESYKKVAQKFRYEQVINKLAAADAKKRSDNFTTGLEYAAELVRTVAVEGGETLFPVDTHALYDYVKAHAKGAGVELSVGISPENILHRAQAELFMLKPEDEKAPNKPNMKYRPVGNPVKESVIIGGPERKPKRAQKGEAAKPLDENFIGKYVYHTTSLINLYLIKDGGLKGSAGGGPGGACYLAEEDAQRTDSIEHSKNVVAGAVQRATLATYLNQRENKADQVVQDNEKARKEGQERQSDLDECGVILRFKALTSYKWLTDPQDSRAILLTNSDVAPTELECLTDDGWVGLDELSMLGQMLGFDEGRGALPEEEQVYLRQHERAMFRLKQKEPTINDIETANGLVQRGRALMARSDSTITEERIRELEQQALTEAPSVYLRDYEKMTLRLGESNDKSDIEAGKRLVLRGDNLLVQLGASQEPDELDEIKDKNEQLKKKVNELDTQLRDQEKKKKEDRQAIALKRRKDRANKNAEERQGKGSD